MNHHAAVENHEIFKLRLGRLFLAGIKGLFHSVVAVYPALFTETVILKIFKLSFILDQSQICIFNGLGARAL